MSIEGKTMLAEEIETGLEEVLTVVQMKNVMDVVWRSMSKVSIEPVVKGYSNNEDLVKTFLEAKRVEGAAESTIKLYSRTIERFLEFANIPIDAVTSHTVRGFMAAELARGISLNTVRGNQDTLSSLFGWLHREELIRRNPCANIGKVKVPKVKRLIFSNVEIRKMIECCSTDRDKAIIYFLLNTGCRIEECTKLNKGDLNFTRMECKVLGKGSKERMVYFDEVTAEEVLRYLLQRKDDSEALFVGRGSERMTPGGIRTMLKRVEERSGVENVHPHRFRRTLATNLTSKGMSIQEVAVILGHANINTTMKYVCTNDNMVKQHYQEIVA